MVLIVRLTGVYKPTNITGGGHIVAIVRLVYKSTNITGGHPLEP